MEFVDLGLPVKWATCNIGATKPEESGLYFAWGEAEGYQVIKNEDGRLKILDANGNEQTTKTAFSWNDYKWCNGTEDAVTKYCIDDFMSADNVTDGYTRLELNDDAAFMLDNSYRMPFKDDFFELFANTNHTWTNDYNGSGISGLILTSKIEGYTDKSIFIPASGCIKDGLFDNEQPSINIWSADLDYFTSLAFGIYANYNYTGALTNKERCFGKNIRPVLCKTNFEEYDSMFNLVNGEF